MIRYWRFAQNSALANLSVAVVQKLFAKNCDPIWAAVLPLLPENHPVWGKMSTGVRKNITDAMQNTPVMNETAVFAQLCVQHST
jgi:spore maturation protein SpmA